MTYRRVIIGTFFVVGNISQQMKEKTNKQTNKNKNKQQQQQQNASDKSCLKQKNSHSSFLNLFPPQIWEG